MEFRGEIMFPQVLNVFDDRKSRISVTSVQLWKDTARGEFRPRQTRQLPRAVDLKGRLLSCQRY